jgi:hypothetical protein
MSASGQVQTGAVLGRWTDENTHTAAQQRPGEYRFFEITENEYSFQNLISKTYPTVYIKVGLKQPEMDEVRP